MSATANLISFIPSEAYVKLAKETKKILAPRLSATPPFDLRAINPLKEPSIKIPAQACATAHSNYQPFRARSRTRDLCRDSESETVSWVANRRVANGGLRLR